MAAPKLKKMTLNELGSMLEHVVKSIAKIEEKVDAIDTQLTAAESKVDGIDTRLIAVESKVDGINRRLDTEAMVRTDQKLPERVSDIEIELYGSSRAPKTP
jgi:phage shock protein A